MSNTPRLLLLAVAIALAFNSLPDVSRADHDPQSGPVVIMSTSLGDIKIVLYKKKSPKTVRNFLSYVNEQFYDGTIFHRVTPNFMIQGGGFLPGMQEKKPRAQIKNEAGNRLKNEAGTVAMARYSDPDSATSQFFINVKDNPSLNWENNSEGGYCVFGKVIEGMDVVHKIARVATDRKGVHQDIPREPVVITSIRAVDAGEEKK
jgi:cyclophilin family peptidyl-prolyl cis-trans isomerase